MPAPRRMVLICFAVVTLVGVVAWLTVALPGPADSLKELRAGVLCWLGWLIAVPILGVVSARRGNPRELLAGCLGAVAGAVAVIEVPHLVRSGLGLESLPSSGLVLDVLAIAAMVGVPLLAVGGLTLAIVRARVDRGSEKPTR